MIYSKKEATDLILDKLFDDYRFSEPDMDEYIGYIIDDVVCDSILSDKDGLEFKAVTGFNALLLNGALGIDEFSETTTRLIAEFTKALVREVRSEGTFLEEYKDIIEQELFEKDYLNHYNQMDINSFCGFIEDYAVSVLGLEEKEVEILCSFYAESAQAALDREPLDR